MIRIVIVIFFILLKTMVLSQKPLNENGFSVTPISGIDWKANNDKSIQFLDKYLDSNSIVVLAESDHGEGSSYDAQCMILKGLIDSGKIDAIFTESSWINIEEIVRILKKDGATAIKKSKDLMRSTELRYWVDNGFWEFLATKIIQNRIKLYGFDIDGNSSKIIESLLQEARNIGSVQKYIETSSEEYKKIKFEYDYYEGWGLTSRYAMENYSRQEKFISLIVNNYLSTNNLLRVKQWKSVLNYFYWMAKRSEVLLNNKYSNQIENDRQFSEFHAIRDSLMADIFYQYFLENRNSKIVALMSSYHALKSPESIEGLQQCCIDKKVKPMNNILYKKYGLNLNSICFISGSGEYGLNYADGDKKYNKVLKPVIGSIEKHLNNLPYEYCFIDFHETGSDYFFMNTEFNKYFKSDWKKNFSGAFFIKKMKPLIFKNLFSEN